MNFQDLKLLTKAYEFASVKHRHQKRKGGDQVPYINHPIEVVNILVESGIHDVKILCGGILHDTIEDTQTTETEIQNQFGGQVLKYVLECSDDKNLDKIQRKIHQIQHSKHISQQAKCIKIADKISNNADLLVAAPKGWSQQRVFGYFLWSDAVFNNLQGINANLDKKMKDIFDEAGVYKLSEEQRNNGLEKYYECLKKSMQK